MDLVLETTLAAELITSDKERQDFNVVYDLYHCYCSEGGLTYSKSHVNTEGDGRHDTISYRLITFYAT